MSVPYDYAPSNIEHLRFVVAEQERTIKYLHERCKEEEAENALLRELMYDRAHVHAIQHMTEDELRITAANALDENRKLRALCAALYGFAYDEHPDGAELNFVDRMRELGVEVDE